MRTVVILALSALACGQDEQASLLQTLSGTALQARSNARSTLEEEAELDAEDLEHTMGNKECGAWIKDKALAEAYDKINNMRKKLQSAGYVSKREIKSGVKIAAWCPVIFEGNIDWGNTDCGAAEPVYKVCGAALKDLSKFVRDTAKTLAKTLSRTISDTKKGLSKEARGKFVAPSVPADLGNVPITKEYMRVHPAEIRASMFADLESALEDTVDVVNRVLSELHHAVDLANGKTCFSTDEDLCWAEVGKHNQNCLWCETTESPDSSEVGQIGCVDRHDQFRTGFSRSCVPDTGLCDEEWTFGYSPEIRTCKRSFSATPDEMTALIR